MWDRRYRNDMDVIEAGQRARRRARISTCPNCLLERETDAQRARDFARLVVCPECGTISKPGRGDRVVVERHERGIERIIEEGMER